MLFESLDRLKRSAVMTTIIMVLAGFMLLVLPDSILPLMNDAAGFVLSVFAVLSVFQFLSGPRGLIHYFRLTLGLLSGLIGIIFFILPDVFSRSLVWLVCVLPIVIGVYDIYHALMFARRSGRRGWWILIVMSAVLIAFGGFIFYNPWYDSAVSGMRIIGGTLMYTAIVSGLRLIWLWSVRNVEGGQEA